MKKTERTIENFKNEVPIDAWALNDIFCANGHKLYIVGGYIRDYSLAIKTTDIDICGTATPQELEQMLSDTNFKFTVINSKLGAYKIYQESNKPMQNKIEFEYTTLREEKYTKGHCPSEVHFVTDVVTDSKRRDFTVNAMYYDLSSEKLIDPCNGWQDCIDRILKPVNAKVFDSDGLRILRLLRFAYTKKLRIPDAVLNNARLHTYLLRDIAHERIAQEIRAIDESQKNNSVFDFKRAMKYGYERIETGEKNEKDIFPALDLLDAIMALKIIDYIFPKLALTIDMDKFYNAYETPIISYQLFEMNFPIAFAYFICKSLEEQNYELTGAFFDEILGVEGLMINKFEVKKMTMILDGLLTLRKMRDESFYINYVQLYYDVFMEITVYARALCANGHYPQLERVETTYNLMEANNIPRCMSELAVNGYDIMERWPFLPRRLISSMLECAMIMATKERRNEKEYLLNELEKFIVRDEI